jgi:hypothetical protein
VKGREVTKEGSGMEQTREEDEGCREVGAIRGGMTGWIRRYSDLDGLGEDDRRELRGRRSRANLETARPPGSIHFNWYV